MYENNKISRWDLFMESYSRQEKQDEEIKSICIINKEKDKLRKRKKEYKKPKWRNYNKKKKLCRKSFNVQWDLEIWLDWRKHIDKSFSIKQIKEGEVPENLIPNKHWCWQSKRDMHPYRIYLKGQKELSMFYLKFNS